MLTNKKAQPMSARTMQFLFNVLGYVCFANAGIAIATASNRIDNAQETLQRCALEAQTDPCSRYRVRAASDDAQVRATDVMFIGGQAMMGAGGLMYAQNFAAAAAVVRRRRQLPEPKKPVAKTPRAKSRLPRS